MACLTNYSSPPAVLMGLFLLISAHLAAQPASAFNCSTKTTCQGLVGYVVPNATTLSDIKTRFGIKDLHNLLGANNLPTSTRPSQPVPAKQTIKIPFPCNCTPDGKGVSNGVPIYSVKAGDGLDHIARDIFAGLLKYQDIVAINKIPDENKIEVGQKLWIPLPCSCDQVNGTQVVHYGHVVEPGSTVEAIAQRFGTTEDTLLKLNGIANASDLEAEQVLDVPLRACSSVVRNDSLDNPLLLPNGTYVLTANNCVKCSCSSAKNWKLQCEASQLNTTRCPTTQCENSLSLGDSIPTGNTCNVTTCSYAGFNNQSIFTSLVPESTCPATSPGNAASKMGKEALSWNFIFISIHLVLLGVGLFL